jgi:hypothetical protein
MWVYCKQTFRRESCTDRCFDLPTADRLLPEFVVSATALRQSVSNRLALFLARVTSSSLKMQANRSSETSAYNNPTSQMMAFFIDWCCFRTGCWGEHVDGREMKWQESGENCVVRSFSSGIIRMGKSRRMRWAWHVALMGEKRNAHRILLGKTRRKYATTKTKT